MTEFWGMVLFGTAAAIIICLGIAIVYFGFALLCSKLCRPEPLAENPVPSAL